MNVYFDSSALAKMWIEEDGSRQVEALYSQAGQHATCFLTLPELRSALARAVLERRIAEADYPATLADVRKVWGAFLRMPVLEQLAEHAGELAARYRLKGSDAVHLATALAYRGAMPGTPWVFACFDKKLANAAASEGLAVSVVAS